MNKFQSIAITAVSAGYTHQGIADYCGCERSTITKLIRGDIENPRVNIADRLRSLQKKIRRESKLEIMAVNVEDKK